MTADDISAKTFFKALNSNDSSLLEVDNHQECFIALKDEYYILRGDPITRNDMNTHKKIAQLRHKLSLLSLTKEVYQRLPLNSQQRDSLHSCLSDLGFKMDKSNPKEVDKLFNSWMSQLRNSLKVAESSFVKKSDEDNTKKKFNFGEILVSLEHVIDRPIPEGCSLSKFIAYEKEAKEIIKRHKQSSR